MRLISPLEALEQGTIAAESGGNPHALHPLVKRGQYAGQRAIGLFGIMPGNVPAWSREHVGRTMTPAELAADTEAQRAIFRGEMQKNLAKHGNPQDAASIWFTGRPFAQAAASGANDTFTNVRDYVAKVTGSAPRMVSTTREGPTATREGRPNMPMQNPYGRPWRPWWLSASNRNADLWRHLSRRWACPCSPRPATTCSRACRPP